jgi:hypothetical protein
MKNYIFLICGILLPFLLIAQNNRIENLADKPMKKGLVLIGLTNNRTIETQFEFTKEIPEDFVNVEITKNIIKPLDVNVLGNDGSTMLSEKQINTLLNNHRIGQQILSYWFARQDDATFDLNAIREKQLLDVLEIDFLVNSDRKRVFSENTNTQKIVNGTYIILVDFKNIKTMNQYYNEKSTNIDNRILKGYISDFDYYVVKLDFSSAVASYFFDNCWLTENTEQNFNKKLQFVATDFPFILINAKSDQVAATQHIQQGDNILEIDKELSEKLLVQLVEIAMDKSLTDFQNDNIFYKYNRIQKIKPVSASMGENENLKFDRRYNVFVNQINEFGKIEQKEVAVVKSMKIVDNIPGQNSLNDLSEFYQIAGKKITDTGMYLEKKNDLGINIGLERSFFGPINTSGRIEYYISRNFDGAIQRSKRAQALTSFKVFFEAGYNDGTHMIEENYRIFEFFRGAIGLSKDFYPVRNLHWSPFFCYGMESAVWDGSDKTISTNFFEAGLRLGKNISHNVQLTGTLKNNYIFKSILFDEQRDIIDRNFNYEQTFQNRKGISFALGIRVML